MSFNVASGVDFFVGITAVEGADFVDAAAGFAGDEASVGSAGNFDFSGAAASGAGAGGAISS